MSWFWILPALLTLTLVAVFQPLFSLRGNRPLPQGLEDNLWEDLAQQRERLLRQLKEWQLEAESDAESVSIRAGLEQELAGVLNHLDRLGPPPQPTVEGEGEPPQVRRPVDMAFGMVGFVLLAVLAGGIYLGLGTPVVDPSQTRAAAPHTPSQEEILAMVAQLAERMKKEPDNITGWLRLARSQAVIGDVAEAIRAYTHVLSRQGDNRQAAVGLAELQIQSDSAEQVKQGSASLEVMLEKDPNHPEALWFLGALAVRAGDIPRARELWQRLLPLLQPDSPPRATVEKALQSLQTP